MRRLEDEQGAIAVIVAIMLTMLFGLGALVTDVGNLYWERRQLQNGADAAAMSAAQELVLGGSEAGAYETARRFADANSNRGAHVALSDFDATANRVTVTARTGDYALPGELSSILAGVIGFDHYKTSARAAVEYGKFGGGQTIPIAICVENWNHFTNNGSTLPAGPPSYLINFAVAPGHADPINGDCGNPGEPGNETYPGGFGFLERDEDCMAVTYEDNLFPGEPGNNPHVPKSACSAASMYQMLNEIIDAGGTVLIPIFYDYQKQGSSGEFKVIGYGGFKLEGYKILSSAGGIDGVYPSTMTSECKNPRSCLKGYYTEFVALGGVPSSGTGPGYGAKLIGFVE
jgi:hypothetical protein